MSLADADDWAKYAVLPEVQQYTSATVTNASDLVPMIQRSLAEDPNSPILFAVREPVSGQLVATVGFHTVSSLNRTAEITYDVHPKRWGQGLATLVCDGALRWAFQARGWVRVQGTTLEPHVASQRVLQKCGFQLEGRLRNFRIVRGEPRDYLLFATVPACRAASAV